MSEEIRVLVPLEARTSNEVVGDLMPVESFYTAGYGCVTGLPGRRMGPAMTYKFNGSDAGLGLDSILVRTASDFANFECRADRIMGESIETHNTFGGRKEFIVYVLMPLSEEEQNRVFDAMNVD